VFCLFYGINRINYSNSNIYIEVENVTKKTRKIECPNCGQVIDVDELLYHKLDEELNKNTVMTSHGERRIMKNSMIIRKRKEGIAGED